MGFEQAKIDGLVSQPQKMKQRSKDFGLKLAKLINEKFCAPGYRRGNGAMRAQIKHISILWSLRHRKINTG